MHLFISDGNGLGNEYQYAAGGHQAAGANEIFAEDQSDKPWWRTNFFISQPVLFGTWDGVFTTVLINIFGVIVFLRSGWIVAQAGILNGKFISVLKLIKKLQILVFVVVGANRRFDNIRNSKFGIGQCFGSGRNL